MSVRRRGPEEADGYSRDIDAGAVDGFLGEGDRLSGEFRFDGTVRVDGHLEGGLVRGNTLVVGESGRV